ncbi:unnamed protein product [Enterobius vermicularis]|uniref:DUF1822 family protein n=1 Tax=Enterobius vermicularis TaxID=51028 RepID=A0A0N4V260_ENTVE|nr:unnamed protein product [Enterobius vermicularis]
MKFQDFLEVVQRKELRVFKYQPLKYAFQCETITPLTELHGGEEENEIDWLKNTGEWLKFVDSNLSVNPGEELKFLSQLDAKNIQLVPPQRNIKDVFHLIRLA